MSLRRLSGEIRRNPTIEFKKNLTAKTPRSPRGVKPGQSTCGRPPGRRRIGGTAARRQTCSGRRMNWLQAILLRPGTAALRRWSNRVKVVSWTGMWSQKTDVFRDTGALVAGQVAATGPAAGHGRAPGATAVKVSQTGSNRSGLKYWKPRIHFSETGQFRWVVRPHPNLLPLEKGQPLDAGLQFVSLGAEDCRGRQGGGSR